MGVCDISSAKVQTKAEKIEKSLCLLWHTVSNHIHNVNALPRPQGQIADIFFQRDESRKSMKIYLLQKKQCINVLHDICCWTSSVGGKKQEPGQNKGFPLRTEAERRQRDGGG